MDRADIVSEVLQGLRPPPPGASHAAVARWQWWVSITLGVTAVTTIMQVLLAFGYLGFVFPGFAHAGEVKEIAATLRTARISNLESSILDVRHKQCDAKGELKNMYTTALNGQWREYKLITGTDYRIPACSEYASISDTL